MTGNRVLLMSLRNMREHRKTIIGLIIFMCVRKQADPYGKGEKWKF